MNTDRRHFFKQLAGIGLFSILPGAGRVWKAEKKIINPDWVKVGYECFLIGFYNKPLLVFDEILMREMFIWKRFDGTPIEVNPPS